jgi:predicted nucleotide-binding protein
MPYYHIRIEFLEENINKFAYETNLSDVQVAQIVNQFSKGESFWFDGRTIIPKRISKLNIFQTGFSQSSSSHFHNNYSRGYIGDFGGREVTRDFITKPPETPSEISNQKKLTSKNIFIVHGHDVEPVKELRDMLLDFGLNPIILHEQASGSLTLAEKLEKYSDVGYAFVILTPDDVGGTEVDFLNAVRGLEHLDLEDIYEGYMYHRARQNVVLEFGYFVGKLGRERVCCLYKGDIELPSDMQGIVYVPFKDSVKEQRPMIMKELKEAGYEIKI